MALSKTNIPILVEFLESDWGFFSEDYNPTSI